mmetsp:Transcript_10573/g.27994  ORF Transcript_10573/g.27994 Transcript_10573/m.27994 type:complete len:390 (+) Transcript_10573:1282-2451(+)
MSAPPTSATLSTSCVVSTVPAPTTTSSGTALARSPMLVTASGEFMGTSIMRKPAATRASPTATTSLGFTPRRIATRGQAAMALSNRAFNFTASRLAFRLFQSSRSPWTTASWPGTIFAAMPKTDPNARRYRSHSAPLPTRVTASGRASPLQAPRSSWPISTPERKEGSASGGKLPARPSVRQAKMCDRSPPLVPLRATPASKASQWSALPGSINLPKIEWLLSTSKNSPVICVSNDTTPSVDDQRAHFECVPGSTKRPVPLPEAAAPKSWVSSPRITSGAAPEGGREDRPGTRKASRPSARRSGWMAVETWAAVAGVGTWGTSFQPWRLPTIPQRRMGVSLSRHAAALPFASSISKAAAKASGPPDDSANVPAPASSTLSAIAPVASTR